MQHLVGSTRPDACTMRKWEASLRLKLPSIKYVSKAPSFESLIYKYNHDIKTHFMGKLSWKTYCVRVRGTSFGPWQQFDRRSRFLTRRSRRRRDTLLSCHEWLWGDRLGWNGTGDIKWWRTDQIVRIWNLAKGIGKKIRLWIVSNQKLCSSSFDQGFEKRLIRHLETVAAVAICARTHCVENCGFVTMYVEYCKVHRGKHTFSNEKKKNIQIYNFIPRHTLMQQQQEGSKKYVSFLLIFVPVRCKSWNVSDFFFAKMVSEPS